MPIYARKSTEEAPGKRRHPRVEVRIPSKVYGKSNSESPISGTITNMSEGGAFLECADKIEIGEEIVIEIRFNEAQLFEGVVVPEEERGPVPAETPEVSTIRWVDKGESTTGFGIEFKGLQSDKRDFLKRIIKYFESLEKAGVTFL